MVLLSLEYDDVTHSLSVIDQLKLPHEKLMIRIENIQDAWGVIRNMQVRGAPLIAIVAVLGLAVELAKTPSLAGATAKEVSNHIIKALDYLRTSRPTAVNLFNACDCMTAVVMKASKEESTGQSVINAYTNAAVKLFKEDLAANMRQGAFGVEAARQDCKDKTELSVLTHCNTGSLATSGFGTALGVIRALKEKDMLKACYATETRPYNQGARLTAFEMVEDNLPGTLITDSMASFLMAQGNVDLVVTGADRVVANGDTANKIGTYQLAIAAQYHKIPFYIVAPTTTLDISKLSGSEIEIEQRPADELTMVAGHRIAAPGIAVWNPAFDVTPASLITAIITDVGVIRPSTKEDGTPYFDVKGFLQEKGHLANTTDSNGDSGTATQEPNTRPLPIPPGFRQLSPASVGAYVMGFPDVVSMLGAKVADDIKAEEVGDGNLNLVFICRGPSGTVVVKQALPYVRCVGESWPLTLERAHLEAKALQVQYKLCPEHTPEVYHFDYPLAATIMRYIEPPAIILRKLLINGGQPPLLADHASTFLAKTLYNTSCIHLDAQELRQKSAAWSKDPDLIVLTAQVVFTDPYVHRDINRWTTPQLDSVVADIRSDTELKMCVARLKDKFLCTQEALIHGDLHTGSIMASDEVTFCIDPEFAMYGPIGFDLGALIGNLLLAYCSQPGHKTDIGHGKWILTTLQDMYRKFEDKFLSFWTNDTKASGAGDGHKCYPACHFTGEDELKQIQARYMSHLLRDALGFAGCKMIRRIIGIAHVEDMESIQDTDVRASCELHAINIARRLLKDNETFTSIEQVCDLARNSNQ